MKSTKKITAILFSIFMVCILTGCSIVNARDNELLINQVKKEGRVSDIIKNQIVAYGLSSGNAEYLYNEQNYYGEEIITCKDEMYTYSFDNEYNLVSIKLNSELRDTVTAKSALSQDDYCAIADDFMKKYLPYFSESTNIVCDCDENSAYMKLWDMQDDCLVNSGVIILNVDGTLRFASGTRNKLSDFDGADIYTKEDIINIVYMSLIDYQRELEENGLPEADEPQKIVIGEGAEDCLNDSIIDNFYETEVIDDMPGFNIFLESQDSVEILEMYKEKLGTNIVWHVLAHVNTTWGDIDKALNFTYAYTIDAFSGEILSVDTLSGEE